MSQQNNKVGIGIVGIGNIAATHADAVRAVSDATLVGACSRSEAGRERFSKKYQVPVFDWYDKFLALETLNTVTICTPSGTHLEYGIKAAEAGKNVIVEKPIEISVERGEKLIDCCKMNGVQLAVIFQNRFLCGAIQMKRAIENGKIGKPFRVRAAVKWHRNEEYYSNSNWRGTFQLDGGGAVMNQSIHTIDLLVWMLGDIQNVSALTSTFTHSDIEAEDNAAALLTFKSGVMGVFEASTSIVPAQPRTIEVNGTKGTAILNGDQFQLLNGSKEFQKKKKAAAVGAENPLAGVTSNLHERQYRDIVNAILYSGNPVVSGVDSLRSLGVAEAIYASAASKQFVTISEI